MQSNRLSVLILLGIFIFSISALAMNGRTTYQAKIVKPDGYPLEASNVNFRFTVLDSVGSCVLYVEDYSAVNMSGGGGLISFALGNGNRSFPVSGTSLTFQNTFDNSVPMFNCQTPGTYNPGPNDTRKIVMQFNDGNGWQTLPAMAINAVPYAMYANKSNDSKTLNGKADTAFVENSTLAALNCNPATHAITFNGVSFSCIPVGSGSSGITSVTTSGTVLSTGGTASAPVISIQAATTSQDGYLTSLDYAEFKAKLAASSTQIINTLGYAPVSSSAVATQITNSNLSGDVSGTISANSVVSVGGKTASQISTSVNDTLAATSSATADMIVKRNSSGNATFNDVYANAAKINYVDIYKPSTSFNIRLQAPTSLSTNYVLNLPTTSGTTGQVLSTDGAGNLSWINPSTGSVVSVSATAPLASTGGSNPTISITQATSSTAGYLSSADWNTFNNKQAATSAAIIATLGYTPADNAASGTYTLKANNLSDLTSSATARTNLGLGTLATANSIDLGSASATGIIAEARLQTQSNVTSGTQYTKVTVDGKGRVTSGTQLSSSDVTTALGYTPANSTSGVTSLNGSVSQTQTFATNNTGTAFGISTSNGVHTFSIPLAASSSVTAGLLSNADYTIFTNKQNATSAAIIATLGYTPANATSATQWTTNGSNIYYNTGNIGVGVINPSAKLELASGTASVAPLKFTSGTLLSSAQSGTMEYDGFNFYLTDSTSTRRTIATGSSAGTIDNASNINSSGNITMTPVGSVIVSSTTASTNSNTGALVVKGGLGVAGNINTAGNLNVSGSQVIDGSLKLSSMTSGSVLFAGTGGTVTQDNSSLYWDGANKRLGIGGNSPTQTLSVSGISYFSGNVGVGTATPGALLQIGENSASGSAFRFIPTSNQSSVRFTTNAAANWIQSGVDFSTDSKKDLMFSSINGVTTWMTLQASTGNVGVGTASPEEKFHVSNGWLLLDNTFGLRLKTASGSIANAVRTGVNDQLVVGSGAWNSISFHTGAADKMYIASSGAVGIGTTAPQTALHVAKDITSQNAVSGSSLSWNGNSQIKISSGNNALAFSVIGTVNQRLGIIQAGHSGDGLNYYPDLTDPKLALQPYGGNVGIGTTAPIATLHVASGPTMTSGYSRNLALHAHHPTLQFKGISDTNHSAGIGYDAQSISEAMRFWVGATSDDISATGIQAMTITASGNVGIGTSSPNHKLEINGGDSDLVYLSNGNAGLELRSSAAAASEYIDFTGSSTSTIGPGTPDFQGRIQYDSTATANNMFFYTSGTERVRITGAGNVGIGTASPSYRFQVNKISSAPAMMIGGANAGSPRLQVYGLDADSNAWMGLGTDMGGSVYEHSVYFPTGPSNNGRLTLGDYNGTTYNTRMTVLQNGNVGIGTTAPASSLHVAGEIYIKTPGLGSAINFTNTDDPTLYFRSGSPPGSTTRMVIKGDTGNVGIGTTAPGYTLHVVGTAGLSTGTAWTNASDIRLKDIQGDYEYGLNEILRLHTVRYNYKKGNALGLPSDFSKTGFIAQEVQKVIPDAVNVRKDGYLELNVDPIHWAVVNAVKDLYKLVVEIKNEILGEVRGLASIVSLKADKAEIEDLRKDNVALKQKAAEVDELKAENEALKAYLCSKDPAAPICK